MIKNIAYDFGNLLENVLKSYDLSVEKEIKLGDFMADLVISKNKSQRAFIELKVFRTNQIPVSQIKRALLSLNHYLTKNQTNHGVLVISGYVNKEIKNRLEMEFGISIWDRTTLYYLTNNSPENRETLEIILSKLNEDNYENVFEQVEESETIELKTIWDIAAKGRGRVTNIGKELCGELKQIPSGRKDFRKFELKCEEILKYIFKSDLGSWNQQARTDDGLHRYDLVCRIISNHDFWKSIGLSFNSRYVLFEFKNYEDKIKQGQVYTTEKYLFTKALRSIGFIISRKGADKNAIIAMKGSLREQGKLLISLDIEDLCKMLKMKDSGEDYNAYLADIIDDFLISLSR